MGTIDDAICSNVFGEWRVKGLSEVISKCFKILCNYYKKKVGTTALGFWK
jgi:hypothetical protein